MILMLWADGMTADQICERTGYSYRNVFYVLRKARLAGDKRAMRRLQHAPARRRRRQIEILRTLGADPKTIAKMVGVSRRLVQIRLKEIQT